MSDVKRKKGETFESLLRRFNKKLIQSGKIFQARKIRFHQASKSRNLQKADALRRLNVQEKREYLQKIGKLKEDQKYGNRR